MARNFVFPSDGLRRVLYVETGLQRLYDRIQSRHGDVGRGFVRHVHIPGARVLTRLILLSPGMCSDMCCGWLQPVILTKQMVMWVYFSVAMQGFRAYYADESNKDKKLICCGCLSDEETLDKIGTRIFEFLSTRLYPCFLALPYAFCFLCWFVSCSWIFGFVFFLPICLGQLISIGCILLVPIGLNNCCEYLKKSERCSLKISKFWRYIYTKDNKDTVGHIDLLQHFLNNVTDTLWWTKPEFREKVDQIPCACCMCAARRKTRHDLTSCPCCTDM